MPRDSKTRRTIDQTGRTTSVKINDIIKGLDDNIKELKSHEAITIEKMDKVLTGINEVKELIKEIKEKEK